MPKVFEKILLRIELLHVDIIDDLVDKRKFRDRTDFINSAIKEKLEREYGDLQPIKKLQLKDWWQD